ncbi:binding-protein-dependent transport systems inner membrane component (plasmid) [Rhizobium leguminosarum bv. trifolii WSM2304]|uniref:Binding-protein-dependent transport systems inner membrane component n=1 Tax=Rhizobium leguminosarum bv. trifolii (strain WSM2304) TaxID=395492 RepID=A0ABF7QZJ7_RHILW|nr:ABC transporter permease [Rhizobium leguminosarum]ACI59686.1 binding-protein-dependent transport systems inner membrane component [Rhizobium leguminosarum bv. trifolii WSM2304]
MKTSQHADTLEKTWSWIYQAICIAVFFFLVAPVLIVIPLSFNAEPYFSFTQKMLALDPKGFSLRWYELLATFGMANPGAPFGGAWLSDLWNNSTWLNAAKNSFFVGICATIMSTVLGTLAALGMTRQEMPFKRTITAILLAPMIVPVVIVATGLFFFYSNPCGILGFECGRLTSTYAGLILAHTALGVPFVLITVKATLTGFDDTLARAAASLGASPSRTFFKVVMPLILPGVVSGALFAFATSFDEVVTVLFVGGPQQVTIPRQMWGGLREQVSPAILAAATILVLISVALLTTVELLRRRSERLRGIRA